LTRPAALVMAKAPVPGRVKTRLEPVFSPQECAEIQAALIERTARWATAVAPGAAHVALDGPAALPAGVIELRQSDGHLGERLESATAAVWSGHSGPLLVVGVDTRLTAAHADQALARLAAGADVVLGPALDGGYWLLALARPAPELFAIDPAAWGGPDVLALTLAAARGAGLSVATLEPERDLDTPADAEALRDDPELGPLLRRGLDRTPLVSVVVPVLDEAAALPGLLDHLAALEGRFEVVVADGGSRDGTRELAAAHPSAPRVLEVRGGRAAQMNAGAAEARGDTLLFLHADTRLPPDAHRSLVSSSADGGNFALRFDGGDRFSRVLGAWYALQRRLGVYYGDSAIWLRRSAFESLGGFRPLPIMDDYDLARRLERGFRTACLPGPAVTSARRWRALGVPRTVFSWVLIRWLFVAGVAPEHLARLYRRVR
jgi:rSAM/selenodomain-associated transferase 2/rSAM/selenodomain-associated transferase 1